MQDKELVRLKFSFQPYLKNRKPEFFSIVSCGKDKNLWVLRRLSNVMGNGGIPRCLNASHRATFPELAIVQISLFAIIKTVGFSSSCENKNFAVNYQMFILKRF